MRKKSVETTETPTEIIGCSKSKAKPEERRYNYDEIVKMFTNNKKIPNNLKRELIGHVDGVMQALFNMHVNPDKYMKMADSHGDKWVEAHNFVVQKYQEQFR